MSLSRRELLEGAAAAALLAGGGRPAFAQGGADAPVQRVLADVAEELLADYPENATALGVDKDARAPLKARLADRSPAGVQGLAERAQARLQRLRSIDMALLSAATRIDVDVVRTAHETAVDGFAFGFGDTAVLNQNWSYRNAPYAVTQNTGAFVEIPDLLDTNHKVENAADAEAYLVRLGAYAAALDGETQRLEADAGRRVIAPAFLIDKALRQLRAGRATPLVAQGLVTSLTRRTASIPGDWGRRASAIVSERVFPALDRQIAVLDRLRPHATMDAGVWRLPQGEAYYAWALRAGTTTRMTPDEVHQMGREQLAALQAEMDRLLRGLGLTDGSVGVRMRALGAQPRYAFPNSDAGRQQVIDYLTGRLTDIRTRLPRAFATLVPGRLVVKRVPQEIEAGAPGGYAAAGTIDGSAPGNFYVNLRDMSEVTRFSLPTLAYHEGIPGHVWQGEYTYRLPLVRSLLAFNAYSEGWALYAEQLADELGVYEGDPAGRLGYLQSIAFRCCRLVVDTGIHAKRWTRDQAIQFFFDNDGSRHEAEVDRYCAWPGQACGYKVGHSTIVRLRETERRALGSRFDLRQYDDAVVKGGNVPLTVLESTIERHIAEQRAAASGRPRAGS
jgi:uncharacterized protein (DUF885 family)